MQESDEDIYTGHYLEINYDAEFNHVEIIANERALKYLQILMQEDLLDSPLRITHFDLGRWSGLDGNVDSITIMKSPSPTAAKNFHNFMKLIIGFLEDRQNAEDFTLAYLDAFEKGKSGMDSELLAILQDLLEDVNAFSPLSSREEEFASGLTEQNLRRKASETLERLEKYQRP